MAKKKRKKTLDELCKHYSSGMTDCPHIQEDGSCSQRKHRPKLCLREFSVKVKGKDDADGAEEYDLFS